MNQLVRTLEVEGLVLTPLTPTIGAEVSGIDLAEPLSPADKTALRRALLDWKVLFFRDQDITTEQHLAFARNFGELEVHPFAPSKPGYPEVLAITHDRERPGKENTWHSDVTWRLEPSLGSILRALEVPPVGGDTLFADMYAAYDGLSDAVKAEIDGAVARHDFPNFRAAMRKRGVSEAEIEALGAAYPNPLHPVVRTHPETGRKAIYVNAAFTVEIVGLEKARSDELLKHLYAQAAIPEYQCRFRWQANSIAFWDNRASQHYAASDYWPAVRRVERVTVVGDKPV
jgi:taurine dioxygenase